MLILRDDNRHIIEWHLGESVPESLDATAEFQATDDELNLIIEAMRASHDENSVVSYSKSAGFRSKIIESLQKAATNVYMAALWSPDRLTPNASQLWEGLRDALGLEPDQGPKPITHDDSLRWLIEYRAARPFPVYVPPDGYPTCDPWKALQFPTREAAHDWAIANGYGSPWGPVQHMFAAVPPIHHLKEE